MTEPQALTYDFFNAANIWMPPPPIYRQDTADGRFYWRPKEDGTVAWYPSVTTAINASSPTSPFLIKWMLENGEEGSAALRDSAAEYGTFMHREFGRLLAKHYCNDFPDYESLSYDDKPFLYPLGSIPRIIQDYEREVRPRYGAEGWEQRITQDILGFMQFIQEYEVELESLELMIHAEFPEWIEDETDDENPRIAGTMDARITLMYKGARRTAIIDFKCGRGKVYESHEIQINMIDLAWDKQYPEHPNELLLHYSPKDWRKDVPTFELKEYKSAKGRRKAKNCIRLACDRLPAKPSKKIVTTAEIAIVGKPLPFNRISPELQLQITFPHRFENIPLFEQLGQKMTPPKQTDHSDLF